METKTETDVVDRQHLIDTAVRFLQNPKVIPTSIENKREFLFKKGLTVSEINTALKQANCYVDQNITTATDSELKQVVQTKKSSTFWSILIKWIKNLLIAGCFAFTAYKLLIKKYFLNQSKKSPNQCIQESLNEMKNSINSLKSTMESINESIKHLKNTSANDETSTIKTELQSVKNLLLNRSQFPQLPNPTPILPSWQLVEKNNISNEEIKNKQDLLVNGSDELTDNLTSS